MRYFWLLVFFCLGGCVSTRHNSGGQHAGVMVGGETVKLYKERLVYIKPPNTTKQTIDTARWMREKLYGKGAWQVLSSRRQQIPFTGTAILFNGPSSKRFSVWQVKDGKPDGDMKTFTRRAADPRLVKKLPSSQQWYINQLFGLNVWNQLYAPVQLQRDIQFDNGKRKSALEYYPDGKLSYAETSGEKGSTIKVYFPNGKEQKTVIVNKSGRKSTFFYENGQRKAEEMLTHQNWKKGEWKSWYANGQLKSTGAYSQGKPLGHHQGWYENGKPRFSRHYHEGVPQGIHQEWYESGIKSSFKEYVQGKVHGDHQRWYENGRQHSVRQYVQGKTSGKMQSWYKDGKPKSLYSYRNNQLHGLYQQWYKNGQLDIRCQYVNNQLHGRCQGWFKNGKKQRDEYYNNGKYSAHSTSWFRNGKKQTQNHVRGQNRTLTKWNSRGYVTERRSWKNEKEHGLQVFCYDNGQKYQETNYRNGKKHGLSIRWDGKHKVSQYTYKNGQTDGPAVEYLSCCSSHKGLKRESGNMLRGSRDGLWKTWSTKGKVIEKTNYRQGKKHGAFSVWYDNGKKKSTGTYQDGAKHGTWKQWNKDGSAKNTQEFRAGKPLKSKP